MEEKKKLTVDYSASKKVGNWQSFYSLFGWLFLVGGIITTIVGIVHASDFLYSETTTLIVGVSILATSLVFLFNSALLKGIEIMVQNAEYNKAIVERDNKVVEKEKQSDFNAVA